ncbi:MAG: FdtA/QdtA family cupin domain-containing protein [Syntrophorhabdaceae bacterium]|jgi:dTDP-4-dehydrorhamnose 3,5-epimerase-like enzyme|nr:FdtA/QdtA family cupin domain-containing protein [Syntrophorhabdales bacterium]MBP9560380.1 FdtA/QdtA family cupin domain-containing protein [Syntrophorhabdaceae bacterium]
MAFIIHLPTFEDSRGKLTIIEKALPFEIKRVYYIYNATAKRGGHRHKKNVQALICLKGGCEIFVNDGKKKETFYLDSPDKCLIVETKDWHTMDKFKDDAILLVLASEYYDVTDYIDEEYP